MDARGVSAWKGSNLTPFHACSREPSTVYTHLERKREQGRERECVWGGERGQGRTSLYSMPAIAGCQLPERESERQRHIVCVCACEREKGRGRISLHTMPVFVSRQLKASETERESDRCRWCVCEREREVGLESHSVPCLRGRTRIVS